MGLRKWFVCRDSDPDDDGWPVRFMLSFFLDQNPLYRRCLSPLPLFRSSVIMPANKKHLTKSGWLRLSKILAGTLGGYTTMFSFHLLMTCFFPKENVIATAFFTGYILWALLLLWAFVDRNVWRVWLVYLFYTGLFYAIYHFFQA
ncbi:hypothetical protein M8998_11020 [Sphingobacterium sp. lm-10]|uniref:hypothetical protein n=1 Tax=Sphingobacterium sp. lm-10 TaxID=2944904 RepID=UPI002021980C|nr:hypothetical protein [Sphingobacterium sp. lm-10]MCL7988471.1 hypothetical protein [Sphingobacterium sp. lm-10]